MRRTTKFLLAKFLLAKFLLAGALMGAAITAGMGTANAQYYPPPPYGYGDGWRSWNGCPPGYTVQGGNCAPYRGPVGGADGVLGTAVHPAIRCRAATVHLIEVRSAARRADTATELGRRLRAICLAK